MVSSVKKFKIAAAQIPSVKGDIVANIEIHTKAMVKAAERDVSILVFPELSLTGYEPGLAQSLVFTINDSRLVPLIVAARDNGLTIVVGAPLATKNLPKLGAIIISAQGKVFTYSKIHLHPGEEKFFSPGNSHFLLEVMGQRVAIAICADTNEPDHAKACANAGASIYAAGVLITEGGYTADTEKMESYAKNHQLLVVMANHNRPTGGWTPIGKSAIWSPSGQIAVADEVQSALVIAAKEADGWQAEFIEI